MMSDAPRSKARISLSTDESAVITTTGISFKNPLLRSWARAAKPSMPGMTKSKSTAAMRARY